MRIRLLASLLVLSLAVPAPTVFAQTDDSGRTMGDVIGDALQGLAREIGQLAPGIDPSDPDAPIDPDSPADGDAVAPGDIDPGSPSDGDDVSPGDIDPSMPGDPEVPAEPAEPGDSDDGIELPPPAEPEEGGFREIFLVPDPAPQPGRWTATNKKGTVVCARLGSRELKASSQTGRITLRDDGKRLTGQSLVEDQTTPVNMTWDPEGNRYRGKIRLTAAGARVNMDFTLRVVNPRKMVGSLTARVNVKQGRIKETCKISRGLELQRIGS